MTAAETGTALPRPIAQSGSKAPGWWGMLCLIATEATLFAMLLFSYFYLRWHESAWPPDGIDYPQFNLIIPATVLLLTSSLPMWWAESGIRRGNRRRLQAGLIVAFVEAAVFIALELTEWAHLGYGPQKDSYASLFFTITGIHLTHVSGALGMNLYLQARAWRGHFSARRYLAVENVALYWHFVDVVWVAIFSTLYISPFIR